MQNGNTRFVRLEDIRYPRASTMTIQSYQKATKGPTRIKKKSNNSPEGIAKAIPGHLAPLIPGLESLQATETKNTTNDTPTRAPNLEPHYDIEHFVPDEEKGYRGVLSRPLASHKVGSFAVRPQRIHLGRHKNDSQTAVAPYRASLIREYCHGQRVSVTARYVNTLRHRETMPDHTNQDQIDKDGVASLKLCSELEDPTPRSSPRNIPKIIVTPSSPANIGFDFDVFDSTSLTPPAVCFKKTERRRQAKAEQNRMVELLRSRSPSIFSSVGFPNGLQVNEEPNWNAGSFSNDDVPKRVQRNVEPILSPFERYAYNLLK